MAQINDDKNVPNKYKVLISFTDSDDTNDEGICNVYWAGDTYPRDGYEPTAARISYLQSAKNQLKMPVISNK